MSTPVDDKQALRNSFKQKRRELTEQRIAERSTRIVQHVLSLPQTQDARVVFSYVSFGAEVETNELIARLLSDDKTVLAPRNNCSPDPECGFVELTAADGEFHDFDEGACPDLRRVDLFIVPGIVWDYDGYRIGFGGGYFDKLLSRARPDAVKVGLAYSFQVIEQVPRDSWDVPVDILVTENGIVSR